MKRILSIILCTVMIFGFAGCSKGELYPNDPVILSIWHIYGSQTESPMNDLIDKFNKTAGKKMGIVVDVSCVTDSTAIDKMLTSSANNEPGAPPLPNLFTAYPRIAEQIGTDKLLDWKSYFTNEELSSFIPLFLTEGYFDDKLLMLPIAKSTELLFLNKTLFDRFAADTGVSEVDLTDFEKLFAACDKYYDWSKGQNLFQINDFYHYFLASIASMGGEFISEGSINTNSPEFDKAFMPLAKAAIYGGLCVEDSYASEHWKTGAVICNIGSTAAILSLRDFVSYVDNTTEEIETEFLTYPVFSGGSPAVIQCGGGLFAIKNESKRMNKAAAIFAKWITSGQTNLDFVTKTGYLPVTNASFEQLYANIDIVKNEKYKALYEAAGNLYREYNFKLLPLYKGSGIAQFDFENCVKATLGEARKEFIRRTEAGEDSSTVMNELSESALNRIQNAIE